MVAYQGEVKFEHAGTGGMARMMKKMATGEGMKLMKVSGTGEVFLADHAQEVHLVKLTDERITVNSSNLLAFDAGIDWDIRKVRGRLGRAGGRPLQPRAGRERVRSRCFPTARRCCCELEGRPHVRRPAGGDHLVERREDLDQDRRRAQDPDRARRRARASRWQFDGEGWLLVQPSEGVVSTRPRGRPAAALGSILGG